MKFRTMTVDGLYGSTIEADSWEEAEAKAEAPPISEHVLDCIEHNGEHVLVVENEEQRDARAEQQYESRYNAPQGPFADND
jgi:hypothetical protein